MIFHHAALRNGSKAFTPSHDILFSFIVVLAFVRELADWPPHPVVTFTFPSHY
jgi:hypothetical protein